MGQVSNPTVFVLQSTTDDITVEGSARTYSVDGGWFKIVETGHEKRGLEFVIPLEHPEYTEEMQRVLTGLETGDAIRMKLISENENNTAWRCFEILDEEIPSEI